MQGTVLRVRPPRCAIMALAPAGAVVQVETEAPLPAALRLSPPCPFSEEEAEHALFLLLPPLRWDGARGVLVAQALALAAPWPDKFDQKV